MVLPVLIEVTRVVSASQAGHLFPNASTGRYWPFNRLPGGVAWRPQPLCIMAVSTFVLSLGPLEIKTNKHLCMTRLHNFPPVSFFLPHCFCVQLWLPKHFTTPPPSRLALNHTTATSVSQCKRHNCTKNPLAVLSTLHCSLCCYSKQVHKHGHWRPIADLFLSYYCSSCFSFQPLSPLDYNNFIGSHSQKHISNKQDKLGNLCVVSPQFLLFSSIRPKVCGPYHHTHVISPPKLLFKAHNRIRRLCVL